MESSSDKQWAKQYLLDPLTAPEPSQETGPGSHFIRPQSENQSPIVTESASRDSKSPKSSVYPTPPASASPTQSFFHPSNPYSPNHRQAAFGGYSKPGSNRSSLDEPVGNGKGRRRGSSLGERYPGDMSHRPLDQLRKETKAAQRSPHTRKKHIPGTDTIDSLDKTVFGTYHHDGPYDATLMARNTSYKSSPVAAVSGTNEEALKATPREKIQDSLDKHLPLSGTSDTPPGMIGVDGRVMEYEEGADLMRETDAPGGAYKRWPDMKYLPEDYKGKGEPSFSIDRAIKEHDKSHGRYASENGNAFEMQPRSRPGNTRQRSASGNFLSLGKPSSDIARSNTTGRRMGEGLKKRFGSLAHRKKPSDA